MILRQIKEEDDLLVQRLILEILNVEYGMGLSLDELSDIKNVHTTYVLSNNGNFWVVEIGGEIAGCLGVLKLCRNDYEVRRMYTVEKFRGRRVAQQLMDHMIEWAKTHNVGTLYLETNEKWKAAHHIYERYGFSTIDKFSLPEEFPVARVATGFYSKVIDAQQGAALDADSAPLRSRQ